MMRRMQTTLRGQLTSITLFIIAFLFLLVGVLQYTFMKDFLYNNKAEALQAQIRAWPPEPFFLSNLNESLNELEQRTPPDGKNPNRPIIFQPGMIVNLVSRNGEPVVLSQHSEEELPVISAQQYEALFQQYRHNEQPNYYLYDDRNGDTYMVLFRETSGRKASDHLLQVSIELQSLQRQLNIQLAIYSVIALFALIAGFILMLLSLRKALKPLHNMIDAVERTNVENLTEQLPPMQLQELNQLTEAYNNMLIRLDIAFESERSSNERMRQFIADASHELRTPITSIHGFLEVLQRGAMNHPKQLEMSLKAMEQESTRMKSLVESLLQLAKLDNHAFESSELKPLALVPLIKAMLLQLELMAGERKISFHDNVSDSSKLQILGDAHRMQQVVLNLVSNAIQHTDAKKGMITITLQQAGDRLQLSVGDNGSGIAEEHQHKLFQRFFRIDKARTRAGGGAGLGLAITKMIVEQHQGQISVSSSLGNGTVFTMSFPIYHS